MNSTINPNDFNMSDIEAVEVWISCQVTNSICTFVDVYVLVCLLFFHQRESNRLFRRSRIEKKKLDFEKSQTEGSMKRLSRKRSSNFETTEANTRLGRNRKFKVWMLKVAISASFVALIKFITDQLKFFYAWKSKSDSICEIVNDVTEIGLFGIILNCIYGFLWMRQWLFYNDPAVNGLLYRKNLIRFSKGLVVVIVSVTSFTTIYHILPQRYEADRSKIYQGCISRYDLNKREDMWPIALYILFTSTFQISLVSLFVYPFVRRKLDSNAKSSKKQSSIKKQASRKRKQAETQAKMSFFLTKQSSILLLRGKAISNRDDSVEKKTSLPKSLGDTNQETLASHQAISIPVRN